MSQPIAIDEVKTYLTDLQDRLCRKLADVDGNTARFHEDLWTQENVAGPASFATATSSNRPG